MALTETEELELLELENAEAIAAQAPKKKKKKKQFFGDKRASGGVEGLVKGTTEEGTTVKDVLETGEAALRGVTTGLFGVGDLASAAGDVVGGQVIRPLVGKKRLPFRETFKRVRDNRNRLEEERPVASGAGTLVGALAPVSRAGQLVQGLSKGKPLLNTAKVAAGGAAAGAITEANLGGSPEDIAKAAGISAVASPVVGGAIRAGGAVVGAGRAIIDKNANAGFKALARALSKEGRRTSPEQLRARADEFRAATGRAPTVSELVGPRGGQDILETVQGNNAAKSTLLESAERKALDLQENLAQGIEGGRVTTGAPRLRERRGSIMNAFMRRNGERRVDLGADDLEDLLDPDVARVLPRKVRQKLLDLQDTEGGTISLREMEDVRGAFRDAAKGNGENIRLFRDLKESVEEFTSEQIPEFGAALGEFGKRSRIAEGVKQGEKVLAAPTREFGQAVESADAATRAGIKVGARTKLADQARQSPRAAGKLAATLADDAALGARLRDVDIDEATRLAQRGAAEAEGIESVAGTIRGSNIKSAAQQEAENAGTAVEGIIVASGTGSGAFKANFAQKLIARFKVPPTAAKKLAEAVTNPDKTEEVIRILNRFGIEPSAVEKLARASNRATSRTAGPATTEDN